MVHDKKSIFLQQLDKAAKILDLLGDFPRALQVLQANLDDPEIQNHKPVLLETLAFLADICSHLGKVKEARQYVEQAQEIDLQGLDPESIEASIQKLQRMRKAIDKLEPE